MDDFHDALAAPVDFNRLKPLMSKRVEVTVPGEAKMKKFEDWEKKQKEYYGFYKNAKRTVPKNSPVIVCPAKKDEVDVICPHTVTFVWTKDLGEKYTNVNLASGEKSKIVMYDRLKLSSKSECGSYAPLYNPMDFKNVDRSDDDDTWGHKFVKALQEKGDALSKMIADELVFQFNSNKANKDAWLEHEAKHTDCKYETISSLPPVLGVPDKDGLSEAIVPLSRTFTWSAALKDVYPGAEFTEGAQVRMVSYEQLKVKEGKVLWISPFVDPASCIKPAGKSGGN